MSDLTNKEESLQKKSSGDDSSSKSHNAYNVYTDNTSISKWQSFKDSFKKADTEALDPNMSDAEKQMLMTANAPLNKSLKNRHIQMIAIGSCIGTGLFVGSGSALRTGGPLGLIIGFGLVGSLLFCTVHSLGEVFVAYPIPGGFPTQCTKFIDSSWGFAMGMVYSLQWLIVLPMELIAASITINYWNDNINSVAFVSIFYVLIVGINLFGARGFGEAEFIFSLIKVITLLGFFILGIVLICGGGPQGGYIGAKYWHDPGCLAHGFKGVCSVFVTASFSFNGTELVGITAAETNNPRKTLPAACKQVFWRIIFFFITSLILVGFLVPYNEKRLLSSTSDASASPFVLAIVNAGIKGLPSVINVVIMIAVVSVANSAVYACSRTLQGMADLKMAPSILGYIDRKGRPLAGMIVSFTVGLLCFVTASSKESQVFAWLMSITGLTGIFTWMSISVCHIRFRVALKAQGRGTDDLAFTAHTGIWGAYYSILIDVLILIAQFWIALYPIGGSPDPTVFFQAYLTVPFAAICYIGHKACTRNWKLFIPARDIDLDTGRKEFDLDTLKQEAEEDKAYVRSKPFYYRIYRILWA